MTIQQISVFLENRAGQLAEITAILSEHQINMRALHIAETSDYGVLRMIVDQPQQAASLLLEHGFIGGGGAGARRARRPGPYSVPAGQGIH